MELLAVLFGIVLITIFMPWINHFRLLSIRKDISDLKMLVNNITGDLRNPAPSDLMEELVHPEQDGLHVSPLNQDDSQIDVFVASRHIPYQESKEVNERSNNSVPLISKKEERFSFQESFEKNIATKIPVWIGALSLICAAFFLVKYSIELGWMKPIVRISLGSLFGVSLLVLGQWLVKRQHIANSERISQGLVGAGLVSLYVSVYAGINLYELISPTFGFIVMAVITALAVILSLRHGQPIAVFGLLGGLLTPALIGSDEPNAIAMFAYLFLLFTGMFSVLVHRGWWILSVIALTGVFCWSVFWFMLAFSPSDAPVLVVFAIAVAGVVLSVTGKKIVQNNVQENITAPLHGLNFAAILGGVLTISWLSLEMSLSLFDWSMLGMLSVALMALAYFKPHIYQRPLWVMLGGSLGLYAIWLQQAPLNDALAVMVGFACIYVGGGAFIMRKVQDPRYWAGLQAVASISLFLICYFKLDLPEPFLASFGMFWGIISLVLASITIYQAADIRDKYKADSVIQDHLVAIYTLLASAFISTGLAIELPFNDLPLAIAGQAAVTALIFNRTGIEFLKIIVVILTMAFAALHFQQLILLWELFENSLDGRAPRLSRINQYINDAPLFNFGAPSLLFAVTFWIFIKNGSANTKLNHIVLGVALSFMLLTGYYVFRYLVYGDYSTALSMEASFLERGFITVALTALGFALLEIFKRLDNEYLKPWALGVLSLGAFRYIAFDLFIHNPYWSSDQFVGDSIFLNGVTLIYGGAVAAFAYSINSNDFRTNQALYKILCLISLFAFSSLSVRQLFHGGYLERGVTTPMEVYSYSVAWLVTGLALLTIGIMKDNKGIRMASLAFLVLTVVKVFVFDAGELEGLYRVFSFLGLGVSLIGLSYFYTRFSMKKDEHSQSAKMR